MNPIALAMDLLLALLLVAALVLGVRLNRRLLALKASHADFAKAVAELDAAALKADAALKGLRVASEETHDALLTRIETARGLILKLEKASEDAAKAAAQAEQAAARANSSDRPARSSRLADLRQAYGAGARPDDRPEVRPEGRPEVRPEIRSEPRLDVRPAARLDPRAEPQAQRPPYRADAPAADRPTERSRSSAPLERSPRESASSIADLLVDAAPRSAFSEARPNVRPSPDEARRAAPARRRAAADEELFDDMSQAVSPGLAGLMRLSLARRP